MINLSRSMFSIIIPVYNVKDYIEECVKSVLEQTFASYEIILVDDGSTDGSGELCDKLAEIDHRIFCYHKDNGGLSSARNYGIDKAKGSYLYFLDSDDFLRQGALADFDSYIRQYNNPDIITENGMCIFSEGKVTRDENYKGGDTFGKKDGKTALLMFLNGAPHFSACGKCFSNEFWKANGFKFTENITSEDLDIVYKIIFKASTIVMTEQSYYVYRPLREGSITHNYSEKKISDILSIIDRWEGFLDVNGCPEDICEGVRHLLGNVYVYYVLLKINKTGGHSDLMHKAEEKCDYLGFSDWRRLMKIKNIIGFKAFSKNFKLLWWLDIHYRMLFARKG